MKSLARFCGFRIVFYLWRIFLSVDIPLYCYLFYNIFLTLFLLRRCMLTSLALLKITPFIFLDPLKICSFYAFYLTYIVLFSELFWLGVIGHLDVLLFNFFNIISRKCRLCDANSLRCIFMSSSWTLRRTIFCRY